MVNKNINYQDYVIKNGFVREPENIEWSQFYSYNTPDTKTPRLLLIGDSIVCGYTDALRKKLDGIVNVTSYYGSKCATSPGYLKDLNNVLDEYSYSMIWFNNGLHSLNTPLPDWEKAFESTLNFIRAKMPDVPVVVVNSTPVRKENDKVLKLNARTEKIAKKLGLPMVDLYSVMDPLERDKFWRDNCHYTMEGIEIQADFAAPIVLKTLHLENAKAQFHQKGSLTGPNGAIE